jgi:hypothetical protein
VDKRSKEARRQTLAQTITGLGKRFQPSQSVMLEGETYLVSDLQALLQEELDAMRGVDEATNLRTFRVRRERELRARNKPILLAIGSLVRVLHGQNLGVLGDFNLEPRKKGKKTIEVKAGAAEKARETRKLRNTMGSRQRKRAPKGWK